VISFQPTEEELAFLEVAKSLAVDEIRPRSRECEQQRRVSDELAEKIRELGFTLMELPEHWGGLELPLISQVQIWQALSFGDLDVVQGLPGPGDAASLIRLVPDHPVLKAYRHRVEKGAVPTAALIDATNAEAPFQTLTIQSYKDGYVLNGTSLPVRQALEAVAVAVLAYDGDGNAVVLWLDRDTVPWEVQEDDYRLGLAASGIGRFRFDQAVVPASCVVARGEEAADLIQQVQARIRVLQAAKAVGVMEAAVEYVTQYTAERKAFGQVIAQFQGVSFRVADMVIETQLAHHLVWEAAVQVDRGAPDAFGSALRALYRAHRAVRYVTDSAVQLMGGYGFVQEYPAEKWMRDAQAHVGLYGRESDLLQQRGAQLLGRAPVSEQKGKVAV